MVYDCHPTITNNTIVYNQCTEGTGGGIYSNENGYYTGANNIIYFNEAPNGPQWTGNADLTYSCSSQPLTGAGNLANDPQFVDPDNDIFLLQPTSPCIDTGDPTSLLDPDSTRADMGCYYHDQQVGIAPAHPQPPSAWSLSPCFPNPFNSATALSFKLQALSRVSLKVYDISGRLVTTLVDGWREAGEHEVTFDGSGLAAGVYIYRLEALDSEANPTTECGKMMLLK